MQDTLLESDAIISTARDLLSRGGWIVAMQACFDDGGKGDASLTCVAGYFVRDASLVPFKSEWRSILGGRRFHMVDLVHGREDFADLNQDQRNQIVRQLVAVIKKHVSLGVIVSVERSAYEFLISEQSGFAQKTDRDLLQKNLGSPFSMCAMLCLGFANRWLEETRQPREETVYYFERGNRRQGEADNFLRTISLQPAMDIRYNYVSHGFVMKNKLTALDAADLLNWEWTQHCKRAMGEESRPERESLKALMQIPHVGEHFNMANIRMAAFYRLLEPFVVPKWD